MYETGIGEFSHYDSTEASQDDVEDILVEEGRLLLGTVRSLCLRHERVSAMAV